MSHVAGDKAMRRGHVEMQAAGRDPEPVRACSATSAPTLLLSFYRRMMGLSVTQLDAMVEEATVDAYGEEEQVTGFFAMMEEYLELPFETQVLGVDVTVANINITDYNQIVAVCSRGSVKQVIPISELPLPEPLPEGAEWIEAYRYWLDGTH